MHLPVHVWSPFIDFAKQDTQRSFLILKKPNLSYHRDLFRHHLSPRPDIDQVLSRRQIGKVQPHLRCRRFGLCSHNGSSREIDDPDD